MGEGIVVRCGSCRYKRQFTLGVGMMYSSLLNVIGESPPDLRKKVWRAIEEEGAKSEELYEALYQCPECDSLEGNLYFRVRLIDGNALEPHYHCRRCESELLMVDEEKIPQLPCPGCGKEKLYIDGNSVILWD